MIGIVVFPHWFEMAYVFIIVKINDLPLNIDSSRPHSDNSHMSLDTIPTAVDDMHAVTEAVLAGRPIDPAIALRIEERAAEFRERMVREHGLLDISVPLTRQSRETGPLMPISA